MAVSISSSVGCGVFFNRATADADDLSGLAVTALCDIVFEPDLLDRWWLLPRTFNGGDVLVGNSRYGGEQDRTALPSRWMVHAPHWAMPQSGFGSCQVEVVAQGPEDGSFGVDIKGNLLAIDTKIDVCHVGDSLTCKVKSIKKGATEVAYSHWNLRKIKHHTREELSGEISLIGDGKG